MGKTPPIRKIRGVALHYRLATDPRILKEASLELRLCALIIDGVLLSSLLTFLNLPFLAFAAYDWELSALSEVLLRLLLLALALLLYGILPLKLTGQTLGKKALGLRLVASRDGQELSWKQVLLRETLGKCLLLPLFGGVSILFTKASPLLHDGWMQTRVVALTAPLKKVSKNQTPVLQKVLK